MFPVGASHGNHSMAASPLVSVTGGSVSADEPLRIQAV